jgi:two-component system response regulator YesN
MYRVILVDDEPWALSGLEDIIDWNEAGFEICGRCAGAAEALEAMEQYDADAVFTDIRMPKTDGLELVSVIKRQKPGVECVIISAYSDFEVARKAIQYRAAGYIVKPLEKNEVLDMAGRVKDQLDAKNSGPYYLELGDRDALARAIQWLDRNSRGSQCCLMISPTPLKNQAPGIREIKIRDYPLYLSFYSANEKTLPEEYRGLALSKWHEGCGDLCAMLQEAAAAGNGQFSYAGHHLVADIQFYIGSNFGRDISLAHIAKQFLLSENYLCELFKKHSGDTIIKFLNKTRLHNARRLLEHSSLSIKEIYDHVGFRDYSYFDRSFKRMFNITPETFRNQSEKAGERGCVNFDLPPLWEAPSR